MGYVVKLRVYIAGPISKGDLYTNVKQSDDAFTALVRAGFAPFNPMWSVFAGNVRDAVCGPIAEASICSGLPLTHAEWVGIGLPWVECAQAVLRLPGESLGADREVAHARKAGIPVFHDVESLITHFGASSC